MLVPTSICSSVEDFPLHQRSQVMTPRTRIGPDLVLVRPTMWSLKRHREIDRRACPVPAVKTGRQRFLKRNDPSSGNYWSGRYVVQKRASVLLLFGHGRTLNQTGHNSRIVFLISELLGRQGASIVLKRLESLVALTHEDSTAKRSGNCDEVDRKMELSVVIAASDFKGISSKSQSGLIGVGLINVEDRSGGSVAGQRLQQHGGFLNRLGMEVQQQSMCSVLFQHTGSFQEARKSGPKIDMGILDEEQQENSHIDQEVNTKKRLFWSTGPTGRQLKLGITDIKKNLKVCQKAAINTGLINTSHLQKSALMRIGGGNCKRLWVFSVIRSSVWGDTRSVHFRFSACGAGWRRILTPGQTSVKVQIRPSENRRRTEDGRTDHSSELCVSVN
ncbi:protein strawberry notch homolog 1 isoform X1 [Lates japonicus]|uniref:Protein strawberry notch homolog 1 isoform X1 n=1 Tax=Lates japonicus TaxID=270547 RepID=A0AAD3NGQ6_LATJO|nr:protein strawberry notch homolog 1 isoform X1 [Lates japonicus]